jgi:hypothetical protein
LCTATGGTTSHRLLVILVPFHRVLVYVIARGHSMTERDIARAGVSEAALRSYVQDLATNDGSTADELSRLSELHTQGVLTDAEFQQQKSKLLA